MDPSKLMTLSVLQPPPSVASTPATFAPRSDKTKCMTKPRRVSRIVYDFSVDTLMQFTHLRQADAAKALGVAPITLKRICQRRQMRWPYRAKRRQMLREGAVVAAHAMVTMKAVDQNDVKEPWLGALPSYCVYEMPSEVPMTQANMETFSPGPLGLPSLKETLGSRTPPLSVRTLYAPTERVDLAMDQPVMEPAPSWTQLPRLNIQHYASIYQSPTYADELSKRAAAEPVFSPSMLRLHSIPKTENARQVTRMIVSPLGFRV